MGNVIVSLFKCGATLCAKHLTFGFVLESSARGGEAVVAGGDFGCVGPDRLAVINCRSEMFVFSSETFFKCAE